MIIIVIIIKIITTNGIWHRKMCHAIDEKQKATDDEWNGITKSRKRIRTLVEKETC